VPLIYIRLLECFDLSLWRVIRCYSHKTDNRVLTSSFALYHYLYSPLR